MSCDWVRITRGLALATWGGFFAYLWLSGRVTTYIGPRTAWVVTLGALTLPIVAVAYLWTARGTARAVSIREIAKNVLLVAPILFALMVPAPSLGALAVKNKRSKHAPAGLQQPPADGQVRLYDIAWAADSKKYAAKAKITTGQQVDFNGFVSKQTADGLEVSRFLITCCAADAIAYSVKVTGTPKLPKDAWVQILGVLAGRPGSDLKVVASKVTPVAEPDNPYG
jgi:uncharacterized repeat protein (TIGR03943 family)